MYHTLTGQRCEVYHPGVRWLTLMLVGATLATTGCSAGTRSPAGAVRALAEAAANGDRDAVYALVGPRTRARLESGAATAAQLSGRRRVRAVELLGVGWFPPTFTLADAKELSRQGNTATVQVSSRQGQTALTTCIKENDAWKVELTN